MSAVFISYRRGDSSGHTGRLYDHLRKEFGKETIFRDIDTIEPGADFVDAVESGIKNCTALIVVIGNKWLTAEDDNGRRIDDPNDFVRVEVASALNSGLRVIPVLVKGAKMPPASALPNNISALARRHALELSDSRWDYDMGRLINALSDSFANEKERSKKVDHITQENVISQKLHSSLTNPEKQKISKKNKKSVSANVFMFFSIGIGIALIMTAWLFFSKDSSLEIAHQTSETKMIELTNSLDTQTVIEPASQKIIAPSTPETTSVNNKQIIKRLLAEAERDLAAQRLTKPAGNNAFEKYKGILDLEPGQMDAKKGIASIANQYIAMATSALNRGDFENTDRYLNRARSVDPQVQGINALETNISKRKQQIIKTTKALEDSRLAKEEQERQAKIRARIAAQKSADEKIDKKQEAEKKAADELAYQQRIAVNQCQDNCKTKLTQCNNIPTVDKKACQSRINSECDVIQEACLSDPQIYILWGDLGAESECLGQWHQCQEDKSKQCQGAPSGITSDCQPAYLLCNSLCQSMNQR